MFLTEACSRSFNALASRWDPVDVVVVGGSPFLPVSGIDIKRLWNGEGENETADVIIIMVSKKKENGSEGSEATWYPDTDFIQKMLPRTTPNWHVLYNSRETNDQLIQSQMNIRKHFTSQYFTGAYINYYYCILHIIPYTLYIVINTAHIIITYTLNCISYKVLFKIISQLKMPRV